MFFLNRRGRRERREEEKRDVCGLRLLMTSEFQRWYKPPDLSVESIPNLKSQILKPPHLSVGSISNLKSQISNRLTASRKLPRHFQTRSLSLDRFTRFAPFLVVDRANCNAGSAILCSDYLEPYKSQLPKWESCLSKKSGLGSCCVDRDSGTLGKGGGGDRVVGNQESDAMEGVSLQRGTGMNAMVIRQRRRDRNQRFALASICNHLHSR